MFTYRLVLLLVFALFIFSPVVIDGWLAEPNGWYQPFLYWLGVVAIAAVMETMQEHDDV